MTKDETQKAPKSLMCKVELCSDSLYWKISLVIPYEQSKGKKIYDSLNGWKTYFLPAERVADLRFRSPDTLTYQQLLGMLFAYDQQFGLPPPSYEASSSYSEEWLNLARGMYKEPMPPDRYASTNAVRLEQQQPSQTKMIVPVEHPVGKRRIRVND